MAQLNKKGHVAASGSVWKSGKKNQGNLAYKFEGDFNLGKYKCIDEISDIDLIDSAIRKKIKKSYPKNTVLLIAFDDHIDVSIGSDLSYLAKYMRDRASILIKSTFSKAFLVGLSGKTFFTT